MADIIVRDHGSVVILTGLTDAGRQWLEDSLDGEATRWNGGFVTERRYVRAITDGAANDGLEIRA